MARFCPSSVLPFVGTRCCAGPKFGREKQLLSWNFVLGITKCFTVSLLTVFCKEKKLTQMSVSETMYPNTFPCLKLRCRKITPCTETVCPSGNGSTVWEPRLLGKGAQVDPGLVGTQVPRCCGCSTAFKKAAPYSSVRVTRRRLLRRGDGVRKELFQQGMGWAPVPTADGSSCPWDAMTVNSSSALTAEEPQEWTHTPQPGQKRSPAVRMCHFKLGLDKRRRRSKAWIRTHRSRGKVRSSHPLPAPAECDLA